MRTPQLIIAAILFIPFLAQAQAVEVDGTLKLMTFDTLNTQKSFLVKAPDGSVGIRDVTTISPATYEIGDFAHGGIVFWVDETGQHGLVCAKNDQSANAPYWAGSFTNTMARGDGPGAGEINTALIIASQGLGNGAFYAARVCSEAQITENGITYGDWYLPSYGELTTIYNNSTVIDATAIANGGSAFVNDWYRASTEVSLTEAWCLNMVNGNTFLAKTSSDRIRAVRRF